MPRRLPDNLPPRGLSEDQAAEYVGMSAPTFLRAVVAGVFPSAISLKSASIDRRLWDRAALDRALDRLSGFEQPFEGDDDAAKIRRAINERQAKVRHRAAKQA